MDGMRSRCFTILLLAAALGSCGGGGGGGSAPNPPVAGVPFLSLTTSDTEKLVEESITLTWSSSNTTSCSASGAWSGAKSTSGSESIVIASADELMYELECSGAGGTVSSAVNG